MTPSPSNPDRDALIQRIRESVIGGLECEQQLLAAAIENQAFFDLDAEQYLPKRESEGPFDWQSRPHRESGFFREVVEVLTDDLYGSGPSRTFDQPAGQKFLERVWSDNLLDHLLQRADQLSHVNGVCAIQVDAAAGDFDAKPVVYRLWGREEFVAYVDPNDCRVVVAVVTIERFDQTTRYRLWTDLAVEIYETAKADGTAGGRVSRFSGSEVNTYGIIPFGFFWYEIPIRSFYVSHHGTFLRKTECRINDRLSQIDEAIGKSLNPVPYAINVPDDWSPVLYPGGFLKLVGRGGRMGPNGIEPPSEPRLDVLAIKPDVTAAWDDLLRYANQSLEAVRVPLSAVRMEQSGMASGVAIVAEQAPLTKRARKRRAPAMYAESYLARVTLIAGGNHYGKPELVKAGQQGRLTASWPEPTIPIPGPERDQSNSAAIEMKTKSLLMVIQEQYGLGREQAVAVLRQIVKDELEQREILEPLGPEPEPEPEPEPSLESDPKSGTPGNQEDDDGMEDDYDESDTAE